MSVTRHRTQEERSAEMRQRLILAALDCLCDHGYARTTTVRVAEMAGVSRGALLHHFASKEDIIATAVDYSLTSHTAEIREQAARVSAGTLTISEFLRDLWRRFSGPLFAITLEHVTESRHNDVLWHKLVPVVRQFHQALDEIWREFFGAANLTDGQIETVLNMTLCLLRGMGVQSVLRRDEGYYESMLSTWETVLKTMLKGPDGPQVDFSQIVESA